MSASLDRQLIPSGTGISSQPSRDSATRICFKNRGRFHRLVKRGRLCAKPYPWDRTDRMIGSGRPRAGSHVARAAGSIAPKPSPRGTNHVDTASVPIALVTMGLDQGSPGDRACAGKTIVQVSWESRPLGKLHRRTHKAVHLIQARVSHPSATGGSKTSLGSDQTIRSNPRRWVPQSDVSFSHRRITRQPTPR